MIKTISTLIASTFIFSSLLAADARQIKLEKKRRAKAVQCLLSFSDSRTSKAGSDFKSFAPGAPRSEEGFVTSTKEVPLTSVNILKAYQNGLFPWNPTTTGSVKWYNPKNHGVAELELLALRTGGRAKNMRDAWSEIHKNGWTVTFNRSFSKVISSCANHDRSNYSHVWLTKEVQDAYIKLHKEGYAHSVEVWDRDGKLIGGTYGLLHRGFFSAESMFHKVDNAGKVAVLALAERLFFTGHKYIDTQTVNDNSRSNFRAVLVSRNEYVSMMQQEAKVTKNIPSVAIFTKGEYTTSSNNGTLEPK